MSILLNDEALCCGARRLAVQLAAALPAPEDGFSPAFQADMTALPAEIESAIAEGVLIPLFG